MTDRQRERIIQAGLNPADFEPVTITQDDILEMLAEQEYRLCLMELGVNEYDL